MKIGYEIKEIICMKVEEDPNDRRKSSRSEPNDPEQTPASHNGVRVVLLSIDWGSEKVYVCSLFWIS